MKRKRLEERKRLKERKGQCASKESMKISCMVKT